MGVWLLACSGLPVVTKHRRLCLAGYGRCSWHGALSVGFSSGVGFILLGCSGLGKWGESGLAMWHGLGRSGSG